jgi:hypothetical protein
MQVPTVTTFFVPPLSPPPSPSYSPLFSLPPTPPPSPPPPSPAFPTPFSAPIYPPLSPSPSSSTNVSFILAKPKRFRKNPYPKKAPSKSSPRNTLQQDLYTTFNEAPRNDSANLISSNNSLLPITFP